MRFDICSGRNILPGGLKRLAVEKDILHEAAGVFETWRDPEVVVGAVEERTDVEVIQREGDRRDLDEAAFHPDTQGDLLSAAAVVSAVNAL